jgi:hypothetical protein
LISFSPTRLTISTKRITELYPDFVGEELEMNGEYAATESKGEQQLAMVLSE